ncbi:hypothetical protein BaRGS_00006176 [Batillaria attramentaria]|uniref:Protein kinase domain-containing protein n=1 Tax=Batillaria attramentaria TaxID=370345 RepID=A0ABD0LSZ7_9CAEN
MGAENSILERCQWGEEVQVSGLDWNLQHAETKDGRLVTVFEPKKFERKYNEMLQRLAQSLKTLRHPSILRFAGAGQTSECVQLVTEHVVPLVSVLDKLSAYEICAGLYDTMDAIVFLHDKVGICHNNISLGAIFVAYDGGWRLGELQHACPFALATSEYLDSCRAFRDQGALSPEEKQGKVEVKDGCGHVRDVYALGVLIEQLVDGLSELGEYTKTFEQRVASCLSADPALRPNVLTLKNDSLFLNDFVQILSFLRNVALKTAEEKMEFFSGLLPRLLALPEDLIGRRLAIPLLSRFVLLDDAAVTHIIPHLLTPKSDAQPEGSTIPGVTPMLSEVVFRTHVIPELQKILLVHDAHIRLVLLEHFSRYAHLFDTDVLREEIFPQILLGLRDTSDAIVAASLRALSDLVPLLGGDTVIGGQRRTFFFHGLPKFTVPGQMSSSDREKSPSSLTEAMHPLKSMANGKPLLKELASLSRKPKGDPEMEKKKMAERERRREEARLRREERQRRLKQQSNREDNADSTKNEAEAAGDAHILTDSEAVSHKDGSEKETVSDDAKDFDNNQNNSFRSSKLSHDSSEAETREPASQDEWSDWENTEVDSALKSCDDVISEEIEAELAQMSAGAPRAQGLGNKVQTSPDPYRVGSPVIPDWEDPQQAVTSDESSHSFHQDGPQGSADESRTTKDWEEPRKASSEKLNSSSPSPGKGLKLVAKKKITTASAAKTRSNQPKKSSSANDLGFGYDIKSIELPTVKQEVDFFADMMPDIKTGGSGPLLELKDASADTHAEVGSSAGKQSSNLFAVAAEQTEDDAGGWGEDADWGTDDF